MPQDTTTPIQRGFKYEVSLYVAIPVRWATLLKETSKHHYDYRCQEAGHHGVINGLFNTALDEDQLVGGCQSVFPVTWSDLDLITKVAEQLEYHTHDHALIRAIRTWLRESMATIAYQHHLCRELTETAETP